MLMYILTKNNIFNFTKALTHKDTEIHRAAALDGKNHFPAKHSEKFHAHVYSDVD